MPYAFIPWQIHAPVSWQTEHMELERNGFFRSLSLPVICICAFCLAVLNSAGFGSERMLWPGIPIWLPVNGNYHYELISLNSSNIISSLPEIISSDDHEERGLLYLIEIGRDMSEIQGIHGGISWLPCPVVTVNRQL